MGIYAGVDVGSRTTKVVLLGGGEILSAVVLTTGFDPEGQAFRCFEKALRRAGLRAKDVRGVVSTGYGRKRVPFAHREFTEITCHGKGARFFFPEVRTVIDMGGQDAKVIALEDGNVVDFVMNDKCAAGTGRFLEVMAHTLEIPLEEMAQEAARASEGVSITSMCTVFAESEVISLIAEGVPRDKIVWGLHLAIAKRIAAMVRKVPHGRPMAFAGGVAKNRAMVRALEEVLGLPLCIPPDPQIVGALGAALLAREIAGWRNTGR